MKTMIPKTTDLGSRQSRVDQQTQKALQKAYAQTELLLSSITSILIGVGQNGLITHWNAVAEKTFGIATREVMNRPFSQCGIQWDFKTVWAGIQECQAKGLPLRLEDIAFERQNGEKRFLGFTLIPLRQDPEGHMECILYGADITERKQIEQLKNEFVSTVSHELRSPLTIIREGVSQVLEGVVGEVNEDQKRFLSIALEGIDRLRRIVDDLLDISKIEAGKLELKKESTDIVSLVKGVSLSFHLQAQKKGLELKTDLPRGPLVIYVDKDRVVQVFNNLIFNAFKFTEKGRIEISVVDKGNEIECCISDTGIGIAEADLSKIFGKFQQFDQIASSSEKGTGLGLAICKGIVESQGGQIRVQSRLGQGTKVIFTLPKTTTGEVFREHLARAVKEAVPQEASLSIIVFDIANYDGIQKKLGSERIVALVGGLEKIIKQGLRHRVDIAIKDTRSILVLLPATGKEQALMVAGRIQQTFDDYLSKEGLQREIKMTCKVATFPVDGHTADELLTKVGG